MSQTIDQKVVEMKFDNSNFETNVKESMSTLDKLKSSLDLEGSAEGFKNLSKAAKDVSFDGLNGGIEDVKVHFSSLEIIGKRVLENITDSAVQTGLSMAKSFSTDLIGSGFKQYEDKTNAVQTIMNATGLSIDEVDNRLSKLIWYADETSYSFNDMVGSLGKFTSAGVDIDQATNAMMGISNWAAVSGVNARDASRAFYNLSQAMGQGVVKRQDWTSIEQLNMNTKEFNQTAIDTAINLGKLDASARTFGKGTQITAENMGSTLSEGWFTSDVLIATLDRYSKFTDLVYERVQQTGESCADAMEWVAANMGDSYDTIGSKAFAAGQEAKTFSDAVDAVKDAVKSQWATLFESAFGNYDDAKETFTNMANSLYEVFATPLGEFNDTVNEAMNPKGIDLSAWTHLRTNIQDTMELSDEQMLQFRNVLKQVAKDHGIDIDEMIKQNGSFDLSMKEGWLNSDMLKEAVDIIQNGTDTYVKNLDEYQDVVNRVWAGEFGVGEERKQLLEAAGYDYEEIQRLVELGYGAEITLEDLGETAGSLSGLFGEDLADAFRNSADGAEELQKYLQYVSGRELRNGFFDNIFNDETGAIVTYVTTFREAFQEIFGTLDSGTIHDLLAKLYTWSLKLLDEERIESFRTTVTNIFHGIHAGFEVIKGAFSVVKAAWDNTLGPLLSGTWEIVKTIVSGLLGLLEHADAAAGSMTAFSTAVDWLNEKLAPVKQTIEAVTGGIKTFFESLFDGKSVLDSIKDAYDYIVTEIFSKTPEGLTTLLGTEEANKKIEAFHENLEKVKEIGKTIIETFKNIGETIQEAFEAFKETELYQDISASFQGIVSSLSSAWQSVKDWFKDKFNIEDDVDLGVLDTIQTAFDNFNTWLDGLDIADKMQTLSDTVENFKENIKTAFQGIKDWIENNQVFQFVVEKLGDLKDAITSNASDSGEEKEPFITRVLNGLKTGLEWFQENLPSIIETIKGFLGAGVLGSLIALILKIKSFFTKGGVASIIENVNKVLTGLSTALKAFAFEKYASGLMKIGIGFAIILGVIGAIAYWVDPDDLMNTAEAVFLIASALGLLALGISKVMEALNGKKEIESQNAAQTSFAKLLDNVGTALTDVASGASKFLKYAGMASLILSVAIALGAMTAAVAVLGNMDLDSLIKGLVAVIALIGALTAAMKIMESGTSSSFSIGKGGIQSSRTGSGANGFALLGMAAAVLILVKCIDDICQYNLPELLKGVGTIGAILLELGVATRIMSKSFGISSGAGLLLMAFTIGSLVKTLKKTTDMNLGDILKGVITLGLIMLEVSLFSKTVSNDIDVKSTVGLFLMAEAILVFVKAVERLSSLGFNDLSNGLGALVGILASIAAFVWVIDRVSSDTEKLGNTLLGIAAIIAAVAVAIGTVSYALKNGIDLGEIGRGIGELAVSLVEGLVTAITGSADAIIGGLVSLLQSLVEYVPQLVDILVDLLTKVLNKLAERMPDIADAVSNFCGALIESFAEAFKDVDIQPLIDALNELLFATAALVVIGKFGSFGAVTKGIGMLAEVIAAFGLIIAAFGALNLIEGFDDFMAGGVDILITIANGIGGFFGALIGSFVGQAVESFSNSLPALATNLSGFMENIQPFLDGASKIDSTFVDSVGNLTTAMLMVTGASFVQTLTDAMTWLFGGNDITSYMEKFKDLGQALVDFSDIVSGKIDAEAIDAASNAAQVIMALTSIAPKEDGLWQKITGQTDLGKFADNIADLGTGVGAFCDAVTGKTIDSETAKAAASAIETLTDVAPKEGGIWNTLIAGQTDLGKFAENVGALGEGVADFCSYIGESTIDTGTVEAAASAIKQIVDIAPAEGGLWQSITGTQDLGKFADNLGDLGKGLGDFIKNLGTDTAIDSAGITAATEAIGSLVDIAPSSDGLWQEITGEKDLGKFADNLGDMGKGLGDFCGYLKDATINADTVTAAATAIETLVNIAPESGGIWQDIAGEKELGQFAVNLGILGEGVKNFTLPLQNIVFDSGTATEAADVIKILVDLAPSTGGIWQDIVGEKDLGKFGDNLGLLGTGAAAYIEATGNTTKSQMQRGKIAAQGLIDIINLEWPATDSGLFGWVVNGLIGGSTDFETLGGWLQSIATMAVDTANAYSGISLEQLTFAKDASQAVIDILNLEWPSTNDGGLIGIIGAAIGGSDQTDFSKIGGYLNDIGSAVTSFGLTVQGLTDDVVTKSQACVSVMTTFSALTFDENNSFADLPTFAAYIKTLGTYFSEYYTSVSEINFLTVAASIAAIKALVDVLTTMADVDFDQASAFSDALGDLADAGITKFSDAFTNSVETVKTDVATFLSDVKTKIDDAQTDFTTAGEGSFDAYQSGFEEETRLTSLKDAAGSAATDAAGAMDLETDFTTSGSNDIGYFQSAFIDEVIMQNLINTAQHVAQQLPSNMENEMGFRRAGSINISSYEQGLVYNASGLSNTVGDIASRTANVFGSYQQSFYVSGWNCMVGIINGLADLAQTLYDHAYAYGQGAVTSFNNGAGVSSPSWKFAESARYCIQGAVQGFEKNAYMLNEAAEETGQSSVDIMKDIMSGLNFEDMDDTLTIRPVLDLSNIQNGASQINEMLGADSAIGLDAIEAQRLANNINKLNMDAAEINGVYDDSNVIAIITDLGDKVDNLNAAINNMKLYINGQTLVGGIVNDMDKALGSLSSKKNAGVL